MKTHKKNIDRKRRHVRIRTKIQGTSKCPRLVIYKSLNNHYAQMIDDSKSITIAGVSDLKDKKSKDKKIDRAKKIGLEIAKLAGEKKIKSCVFDRNGFKFHGRVKAIAEGAREGGLKF